MYLKTVSLRDFAGLDRVEGLRFEPGLNVVVGDNEAGKSTILLALRAAFFQKHRTGGEGARMLAPYGRQARPEVEVEFALGEVDYALRKSFLVKPEAELSWTGGRLVGDPVEDRLSELLRFTHSGARKVRDGDYAGAFGLLWVDQGRSTQGLDVGAGRDAVTASLEGEVGRLLGGEEGAALVAAAKSWQDRFFTDRLRTVVSSPLREAEDDVSALGAALEEARRAFRDYEEKIDRLAARRHALAALERDDAVGEAERRIEAAEAEVRALAALDRDWREADTALRASALRRDHLAERLREREALAARAAQAAAGAGEMAQRQARHAADARAAREEADRLADTRAALRERVAQAERAAEAARDAEERRRLAGEREALARHVEQAVALARSRADLAAGTQGPVPDDRALREIEAAEAACRDAAVRLEVAAPTLRFAPAGTGTVSTADGALLPDGEPFTATRRTTLRLSGFGEMTIDPGGGAEDLRHAREAADDALAALLRRHGVASLEDARRRQAGRREALAGIARVDAELRLLVPDGLDAARERLARLAASDPSDAGPAAASADAAEARAHHAALRGEFARRDAEFDAARRRSDALALHAAAGERDAAHAGREAEAQGRELAGAEAARPLAALREDVAAAEMDRAAKALVAERRRAAFEGADAETAARTLQARRRSLEEIRRDAAALREEVFRLEGELRAQGATALGEEVARLEDDLAATERRRARLALEADAARLLHATLSQAQREARENWLGPIRERVRPYLGLVHPGTDIDLDETTLEITGLRRGGVEEEYRRLSAGAREQVAVVTRLALAEVLKGGGHPAAVILDDALVNTDEKRLERMHLVLQRAAEGVQIIVLTCRERDFRGLGAPIFRL